MIEVKIHGKSRSVSLIALVKVAKEMIVVREKLNGLAIRSKIDMQEY
jgi:hypothetical protein